MKYSVDTLLRIIDDMSEAALEKLISDGATLRDILDADESLEEDMIKSVSKQLREVLLEAGFKYVDNPSGTKNAKGVDRLYRNAKFGKVIVFHIPRDLQSSIKKSACIYFDSSLEKRNQLDSIDLIGLSEECLVSGADPFTEESKAFVRDQIIKLAKKMSRYWGERLGILESNYEVKMNKARMRSEGAEALLTAMSQDQSGDSVEVASNMFDEFLNQSEAEE